MRIKRKLFLFTLLLSCAWAGNFLQAQTVYTFTPAGATGSNGPNQTMTDAAYTGTTLDGDVTTINGIQYWEIPSSGTYRIEGFGGQGYGSFGGRGAHISGEFYLNAGDTLKILVGQKAGDYLNFPATTYDHQFGGGGGSFVTTTSNTPLIVAGGGGGNHGAAYVPSADGQITNNGAAGANGSVVGAGGTAGQGGLAASSADAGGGLLTNGAGTAGGKSFLNGGAGGFQQGFGGFGGGGGTSSWNNYRGGGGGGYSGGGGGNNAGTCCPTGGGGGSFNAGTNPVDLSGVQIGQGMVVITYLKRFADDAGIDYMKGFAPPVCQGTYPVEVVARNYGNNLINPVTIQWSVNGVMQNDTIVTTPMDTANGPGIDTVAVVIGNVTINTATTIRVWTTLPNSTVDSAGFNDTLEVLIAAPAIVNTMVDATISCNGASDGGATAMGTGGTPNYTYVWSTGDVTASFTGQPAGTYTVTVTDADGCTHSNTATITEPDPLVGIEAVSDISCNGQTDGMISVNPTGGTPGFLIVWTPGGATTFLDSLSAGTYSYTITDANGCSYTNAITITDPAAITVSTTVTDETAQGNGAVDLTVSGGTGGFTYQWSNGATTEDITGVAGGNYTCVITDGNGCVEIVTVTVGTIVGIDPEAAISFSIYPNPSNGTFKVSVPNTTNPVSIEVMDIVGSRIRFIQNAGDLTEVNLTEGAGVYFVKISDGTSAATQRVVITK